MRSADENMTKYVTDEVSFRDPGDLRNRYDAPVFVGIWVAINNHRKLIGWKGAVNRVYLAFGLPYNRTRRLLAMWLTEQFILETS